MLAHITLVSKWSRGGCVSFLAVTFRNWQTSTAIKILILLLLHSSRKSGQGWLPCIDEGRWKDLQRWHCIKYAKHESSFKRARGPHSSYKETVVNRCYWWNPSFKWRLTPKFQYDCVELKIWNYLNFSSPLLFNSSLGIPCKRSTMATNVPLNHVLSLIMHFVKYRFDRISAKKVNTLQNDTRRQRVNRTSIYHQEGWWLWYRNMS